MFKKLCIVSAMTWCFNIHVAAQTKLQTGTFNYSIPLTSYSDATSGIAASISLDYSSGNGLKVNSVASNVGTGWFLNAGGSITRIQNGEPDDQSSIPLFPQIPVNNVNHYNQNVALYADATSAAYNYVDNYYPNGYLHTIFPVFFNGTYGSPKELAFAPRFKSNMGKQWKMSRRALADRQQDVFAFSFNGRSGSFVIGKDGTIKTIEDSKLKIELIHSNMTAQDIRTTIKEFTITDETGVMYKFACLELAEVTNFQLVGSENGDFSFRNMNVQGKGKYIVEKWYLTEIKNPFDNRAIDFQYITQATIFTPGRSFSYQTINSLGKDNLTAMQQSSRGKLQRISKITYPDQTIVSFQYFNGQSLWEVRKDNMWDPPLTEVKVEKEGKLITRYVFKYGYLHKKEIKQYDDYFNTDPVFSRLCLLGVQKFGTLAEEAPYTFDYYVGLESSDPREMVPPTECWAQDHWGYFNKSSIVDLNIPTPTKEVIRDLIVNSDTYRNPAPGCAKLGLMKSISNPLGAKTNIEYEQNQFFQATSNQIINAGGVRVSKLIKTANSTADAAVSQYYYVDDAGNPSSWGYESPAYGLNRNLRVVYDVNGYNYEGIMIADVKSSLIKLGIKSIVNTLVKGLIHALEVASSTVPEPVIQGVIIALSGLIERLFVLFNPDDTYVSTSYGFYPNKEVNPIGLQYSRVEETLSTSGGTSKGKIIYEFSKPANMSEITDLNFPYSTKQRFADWKYGLPKRVAYLNGAGAIQKEVLNDYNVVVNQSTNLTSDNNLSCKVEPNQINSGRCEYYTYTINDNELTADYYTPIFGRSELIQTKERIYNANSNSYAETITNYEYNGDYLLKSKWGYNSKGQKVETIYKYSNDYNVAGEISALKQANNISAPVLTESYLYKTPTDRYMLSGEITGYGTAPNGNIVPSSLYRYRSSTLINESMLTAISATQVVRDNVYYKQTQETLYDAKGHVAQVKGLAFNGTALDVSRKSAMIYDDAAGLSLAVVENAQRNEIGYTSFEQASTVDNWNYDQSQVVNSEKATGSKSYQFGPAITTVDRSNLNSLMEYEITFWAKGVNGSTFTPYVNKNDQMSGSQLQNAFTPIRIYTNPVTGWSLYRCRIDGPTKVSINNQSSSSPGSGSSFLVDEVRIYPVGAAMKTVCYDYRGLAISTCDDNNKMQHTEYDGLGRVLIIRDEEMNIIKTFEYNFKK